MTVTIAALRELLAKATPGPWEYRPIEFDDWGVIRSADGFHAARGGGAYEADHDTHRKNGTDPYGPNSLLIVAMRNNLPTLLDAAEKAGRYEKALRYIVDEKPLLGLEGVTLRHCQRIADDALSPQPPDVVSQNQTIPSNKEACFSVVEQVHPARFKHGIYATRTDPDIE